MITEIQNTRDIQIVRAVWGDFNFSLIPKSPQYNEIVYVWGIENKSKLDSLGYKTILCDRNNVNFKYTSFIYTFMHKVIAINKANKLYSKYIFLDWDYQLVKNLDDSFFNYLDTKNFLAPLYSYDTSSLGDTIIHEDEWGYNTKILTPKFSWEYENMYILPNAGFIYVNNSNILNNLSDVIFNNKLKCLVEEYSIYNLSNCNLDEYVKSYHPTICSSSNNQTLTDYISSILEMDIYFKSN